LLGAPSSGKTSLLIRFVDEVYNPEGTWATVGIELKSITLQVDKTPCRLQIWDTTGQETFFALTRQYFRGCQGAIIVFDLTKRESLRTVDRYIHHFRIECPTSAADNIVLVGNKVDKTD
jgi:small GTP-binding protein